MKVTIGGIEIMNTFQEIEQTALPVMTEAQHIAPLTLAQVNPIDVSKIEDMLVSFGQDVLIGAAGVIVVVAGIMMAVGLKKEGWKRVTGTLQGLGVGLIGPTAVVIVAGFFSGFAQMLN